MSPTRVDKDEPVQYKSFMDGRWRECLLYELVQSQAYWADETRPLDDSLRSYLRAREHKGLHRRIVRMWLVKAIHHSRVVIDPQLFDRFYTDVRQYRMDPLKHLFELGGLELEHPTHPSPSSWLSFFEACRSRGPDYMQSSFARELCESDLKGPAFMFLYTILHTAQLSEHIGMHETARSLLDFGFDTRPDLFRLAEPTIKYSDATMSKKRRPSASELRAGIPVDDEGNVLTGGRAADLWKRANRRQHG